MLPMNNPLFQHAHKAGTDLFEDIDGRDFGEDAHLLHTLSEVSVSA